MTPPSPRTLQSLLRLRLAAVAILCLGVFGGLWAAVRSVHGAPLPGDRFLEELVSGIHWGPVQPLVDFVAWLNGPRQTIAGFAIVIVVGVLWLRVAPLMIAGALSGSLYSMLLSVIARPRPPTPHAAFVGFGFPSGHAVFFTTNAVLLALVLRTRLPTLPARLGMVLLGLFWLVALTSRVWDRAHWPSDVFAGAFLALGWVLLVLSVRWLAAPVLERRR